MEANRYLFSDISEDLKEEQRQDSFLTSEEIDRLTIDENLGDLERAKLLLSPTSHKMQQTCGFENLPALFHIYGAAAYKVLFPDLKFYLEHQYASHMQVAAGRAFALVMQDADVQNEIASLLLPTALCMIDVNRDYEVVESWLETLCAIAPKLSLQMMIENLLPLALERGKVDETAQSRAVCARLFGAISSILERQKIESLFLDKAMVLCQDTDAEVRLCMCEQLNSLSRALGIETTKRAVIPELCELLKDEQLAVRSAAFKCLVDMLDYLPSDIKRLKVLPLVRLFSGQNDEMMLTPLVSMFADLLSKMAPDIPEEDLENLVDSYKSFARHPNDELRQLCAQNFVSILRIVGARKYAMSLHTTFVQLGQDPSACVRCKIGSSFHEISKILGKERTATYLKDTFFSLLRDTSPDVQASFLAALQHVLGQFSVIHEQQRMNMYATMIPHLLQAELNVHDSNQWRLQTALLEAFSQLPNYLKSEQIFQQFVPICFHYMIEGVLPVRTAAARTLAIFIRNHRCAVERYDLAQRVVKEFAHAHSYISRIVYIDFCESFLSISSTRMFKENFLEGAILVLQDEVASVRMHACVLLPLLKTVVKLPEDVVALERINFCTNQRLNDDNNHVAAAARNIAEAYKHVFVRGSGVEPGTDFYALQAEFESLDKEREDEEWNLLSKDQQEEKHQLHEMLHKIKIESNKKNVSLSSPSALQTEAMSRKSSKPGAVTDKLGQSSQVKGSSFSKFRSDAAAPNPTQLKIAGSVGINPLATSRFSSLSRIQLSNASIGATKDGGAISSLVTPFTPSSGTILSTGAVLSQVKPPTTSYDLTETTSGSSAHIKPVPKANIRSTQVTKRIT